MEGVRDRMRPWFLHPVKKIRKTACQIALGEFRGDDLDLALFETTDKSDPFDVRDEDKVLTHLRQVRR